MVAIANVSVGVDAAVSGTPMRAENELMALDANDMIVEKFAKSEHNGDKNEKGNGRQRRGAELEMEMDAFMYALTLSHGDLPNRLTLCITGTHPSPDASRGAEERHITAVIFILPGC